MISSSCSIVEVIFVNFLRDTAVYLVIVDRNCRLSCQRRFVSLRLACVKQDLQSGLEKAAMMNGDKDRDKYSMEIMWSDEDQAYIVTVPELPGCKTHGSTYEEAVQKGKEAIESWIEASRAWGDPIPPPRKLTAA